MSNLIYEVKMYRPRAYTIFSHTLKIFDDMLVFRKRHWFQVDEIVITYTQIIQANLIQGIFFSRIEVVTSGVDNPNIPYVLNGPAKRAQKIIQEKIHKAYANYGQNLDKDEFKAPKQTEVSKTEHALNRLKELKIKGKLTEKEFEIRRKALIKKL